MKEENSQVKPMFVFRENRGKQGAFSLFYLIF